MNPFKTLVYTTAAASIALAASAADLKQSKFTQVINDVKVIAMSDKSQKAASVNEIFKLPDMIRTGPSSRAELVAEDRTITRVGANTIFSFDPANRTINLEQGSLLFHSPKGKGGGTVRSGSATAAVLGTTIMVSTTSDGGFKVLVLEGTAKVKLKNGKTVFLNAGEMVFVLPGGDLSPVTSFRLDTLVAGSKLVNGFDDQLPSLGLIEQAISGQEAQIASGEAADTGLLIGDVGTVTGVQTIDPIVWPQETLDVVRNNLGDIITDALSPAVLNEDLIVNSSSIPTSHVFSKPTTVTGPGISGTYTGAFGRNIIFQEGAGTVDLTLYHNLSDFTFLASQNITFETSVSFSGRSISYGNLIFSAPNGTINMAYDSSLSYDGSGLYLQTGKTMSFDTVYLNNRLGTISLNSQMDLSLKDSYVTGSAVNVSANGNVNLNNTTLDAGGQFAASAHPRAVTTIPSFGINVISRQGSITVTDGSFYGSQLSMRAANWVTMNGTYLGSLYSINITGHTLVLQNVDFQSGSTVRLASLNGLLAPNPNTGAAAIAGYVNFVNNVTYGGSPAQFFVNPSTGSAGIFISKNGQSAASRISSKGPRQLTMQLTKH